MRNADATALTKKAQAINRYINYVRRIEQNYADLPQSVTGFPQNKDFGSLLESLIEMSKCDEKELATCGNETADLVTAIAAIRDPIEQVRTKRHWVKGTGYNDFQSGLTFKLF